MDEFDLPIDPHRTSGVCFEVFQLERQAVARWTNLHVGLSTGNLVVGMHAAYACMEVHHVVRASTCTYVVIHMSRTR